ncbi:MAG: phosphatidylinositol-specific phospholipase C domain-containing protein [Lachnospiraceae bacterium]|nr:phosphatidylinositol-specific phospholipase C domain-containing protein [Lachnospiraceae bacterium]
MTKKNIRIIVGIPAGLIAVILAAAIILTVIPLFEKTDKTPVAGSESWMKGLDNEKYISDVILPGTHDSASYYASLPFFSKCQGFDIGSQLQKGFRYLDIRLEAGDDGLRLVHGFAACRNGLMPWSGNLMLSSVLEECYAFLDEHPTEFIVFAIKQDHGDESISDFQTLVKTYIDKDPKYWLLTDNIPTVGQARGKIVLMRRYSDALNLKTASGISYIWKEQNNRENTALAAESIRNGPYELVVQDRFKYNAGDKWEAFLKGLGYVKGEKGRRQLLVNFLSTNGDITYGHPYGTAKKLNAKLLSDFTPELTGWVIVDFGTAKMAEKIYNCNFK